MNIYNNKINYYEPYENIFLEYQPYHDHNYNYYYSSYNLNSYRPICYKKIFGVKIPFQCPAPPPPPPPPSPIKICYKKIGGIMIKYPCRCPYYTI